MLMISVIEFKLIMKCLLVVWYALYWYKFCVGGESVSQMVILTGHDLNATCVAQNHDQLRLG